MNCLKGQLQKFIVEVSFEVICLDSAVKILRNCRLLLSPFLFLLISYITNTSIGAEVIFILPKNLNIKKLYVRFVMGFQ